MPGAEGWLRVRTIPAISTPTEVRADFPAEPASAGRARRFVDATLRAWECDSAIDVASLLVSELVANSVLHAGTPLAVVITRRTRRLRIEVQDGDIRQPARKHYSSMATTGRGLMLVERLAADWGVRPLAAGKGVWFELSQTAASAGDSVALEGFEAFDIDAIDALEDSAAPGPAGSGGYGGADPGAHARVWVLVGTAR